MKRKTFLLRLSVLASAIALLAGCGGGGGGSGDAASPAATGGTIGGIAAKGYMKGAKVSAFCGNSEAATDLLATGVTGTAGEYSLKWTTACTKVLKLVVENGTGTKMADEATGQDVDLPDGFKLRALVADPTTTTKHITPFTDMAAEIAGTSATKAAILNAESAIVKNVLGGDINAFQAKPVAPTALAMIAASADERKLATLLTIVSAFAQDNATCRVKTTHGARIKCATDLFAAQAKATVTAVSDTGYTVATTVPAITPASMLAATLVNLTAGTIAGVTAKDLSADILSDASGTAAMLTSAASATMTAAASTGGTVVVDAAKDTGIQAARNLFNSLKTDLLALSNSSGNGFLDQKLSAAQTDWSTNGQVSAAGLMEYMKALERATQMASDAKTWTAPAPTGLVANAAYPVAGQSNLILITNSAGVAHQFVRYFASFIDGNQALAMNCRVNVSEMSQGKAGCVYGYGKANVTNITPANSFTTYFHRVQVGEGTTSGSYGWLDGFASRVISSTQRYAAQGTITIPVVSTQGFITQTSYATAGASLLPLADTVPDAAPLTGTATLTRDSSTGDPTALSLKGDIQPLAAGQDNSTLEISAALTSTSATKTAALTGTLANVKGGAATLTMTIASGSQFVGTIGTATTPDNPVSAKLIAQIKTTGFQYDGTFVMDTFTADKSGKFQPGNASFNGKISTVASGTATEFLNGVLGMKLTNLADFDPRAAISATNFRKQTASFTGKVTNGTATYELTFVGDGSTYAQESVTLNYTRSGTQMVSFTGTKSDTVKSITVSGSGSVNAVLNDGIGDVLVGTTKVGSISKNPSQVNFIDGTYLLLGV